MFEIGQVVKWKVGNMNVEGIVRTDNEDGTLEVVINVINNKPARQAVIIKKDIVK